MEEYSLLIKAGLLIVATLVAGGILWLSTGPERRKKARQKKALALAAKRSQMSEQAWRDMVIDMGEDPDAIYQDLVGGPPPTGDNGEEEYWKDADLHKNKKGRDDEFFKDDQL